MTTFFWSSGRIGWGVFAIVVFSGLWLLLADVCWRVLVMKWVRLLAIFTFGWLVGAALIVLGFFYGNH